MPDFSAPIYSQLDGSNNKPSPDGLPVGTNATQVGGAIRAHMGAGKRFYDRINPTVTSTGTADNYALTYAQGPAGYVKGETFSFFAHATNAGPATLAIGALTVRNIVTSGGDPLAAGAIVAGAVQKVVYDGTRFRLQNFTTANATFSGATKMTGTLEVTGATTLASDASIAGKLTVVGDTTLLELSAGDTTLAGLSVAANTNTATLNVTGGSTLADLVVGGVLGVSGATALKATTVDGALNVVGATALKATTVDGALSATSANVGGQRVLTLADNGPGNGLNSDLLDGQHGSFYASQANLTSATSTLTTNLGNHTGRTDNPHSVSKAQVGLGSVDNRSEAQMAASGAIFNRIEVRAANGDYARNNALHGLRRTGAGTIFLPYSGTQNIYAPAGAFVHGVETNTTSFSRVSRIHCQYIQGYSDARGWFTID